jgi:hypothetical protein
MSERVLALVLVLIIAPFSLVLLAAIIRGYSITVVLHRRFHRGQNDDEA